MQQNLNTKYGVGAYNVINFGECGSTMQRHADSPYDQRPSWPKVLNTSSDIIVIMLGTNDAKDLSDGGPPNWENNGVTGQARGACQTERFSRIPHMRLPCRAPDRPNTSLTMRGWSASSARRPRTRTFT